MLQFLETKEMIFDRIILCFSEIVIVLYIGKYSTGFKACQYNIISEAHSIKYKNAKFLNVYVWIWNRLAALDIVDIWISNILLQSINLK